MKFYKALHSNSKPVSAMMYGTCLEITYDTSGVWNDSPFADKGLGVFVFEKEDDAIEYGTAWEVEAEDEMPLPNVFYNYCNKHAKTLDEMSTSTEYFPQGSRTFKRIRFIKQVEDERQ